MKRRKKGCESKIPVGIQNGRGMRKKGEMNEHPGGVFGFRDFMFELGGIYIK